MSEVSEPRDGGPAFTTCVDLDKSGDQRLLIRGMSLRDWFAGQVLRNMPWHFDSLALQGSDYNANLANACYKVADIILAARKGTPDA